MTRLKSEWISDIDTQIQAYNDNLQKQLEMDLAQLTAKACGLTEKIFCEKIGKLTVAVIPITAGQGVIGAFSESVAAIVRVLGANVFVTEKTDVVGIKEGLRKGADILFMADDEEYIAVNIKTGAVGDNNIATAMGYVSALEKLAGNLINKKVLVIGCGIIGRNAIGVLRTKGANISVYDKDSERVKSIGCERLSVLSDDTNIKTFEYILDATNEGGWLHGEMLADNVIISTPGVPLSLDKETYDVRKDKVVHDYLQIGTAVMLGLVL